MSVFVSVLWASFFSLSAFSQTPCYEVRLEQRVITCFKAGAGSISSEERSNVVQNKIHKIADDYVFDPQEISVSELDGTFLISAKEISLISLSAKDFDKEAFSSLEDQADQVSQKIRDSISEYRRDRSSHAVGLGVLFTLLASLGLYLSLKMIGRVQFFLTTKLYSLSENYIEKLRIRSYQLVSPYRVRQILGGTISVLKTVAILTLFYFYIPLVLSFFPWTALWAPKIINYILDPAKNFFQVIINYLPNIFNIIVIVFITRYILKFVNLIFTEIELGNIKFESFYKEWAQPTYKLVRVLIFGLALVMIFPYLPGSSSPAFQGLSVFLGVLISFGSGSAIANVVSGIVITYMRPFRIGDRVKIAETIGDVIEKNFLVTRIRTIKNVDVTIPNAMVLSSHIINYSTTSKDQGLILNTTVTIGYDVPWAKVHELLLQAASKTELIDKEKKSFILQTALNDFYVSYELNAYTREANKMANTYSDLHCNIQDMFNEAGVEIMSPHYSSLRDGNEIAIPESYRDESMKPAGFKFQASKKES